MKSILVVLYFIAGFFSCAYTLGCAWFHDKQAGFLNLYIQLLFCPGLFALVAACSVATICSRCIQAAMYAFYLPYLFFAFTSLAGLKDHDFRAPFYWLSAIALAIAGKRIGAVIGLKLAKKAKKIRGRLGRGM